MNQSKLKERVDQEVSKGEAKEEGSKGEGSPSSDQAPRSPEGKNIMGPHNSISFKPSDLMDGAYRAKIPKYPESKNISKEDKQSQIKELRILYDMLKEKPKYKNFFKDPNREKFNKKNFNDLRIFIYYNNNPSEPKVERFKKEVSLIESEDFAKEFDRRVNKSQDIYGPKVEGSSKEQSSEEVSEAFQESSSPGSEESSSLDQASLSDPPKQNMIDLYDKAQKKLTSVGIETPLNDLLIPLDLKERFLTNLDDDDVLYDVVREASKNYAINVYKQRYKEIEDSSFKSFLEEAINEGLINPYKYFDKNHEEHVMYLFGDKAMTEPELRDEFNKYRFKNLIKGSKNKLHEAAERAIMKKREKQLEAYKEMKQTTHDATRPKMVLNPMLFNHN